MNHLCIVNPMSGLIKGRVNKIVDEIHSFFDSYPRFNYSIYITRWKRDASGFIPRFIKDYPELVRVYAFGGNGTLFEVINGAIGLPNIQVAWYPLGIENIMLSAFGQNQLHFFRSINNLCLFPVTSIDTIQAGNHNIVCNALIGIEASAYLHGVKAAEKYRLPRKPCYIIAGIFLALMKKEIRHFRIEMDNSVLDDNFLGIMVSNASSHGAGMVAPEASINDGYMDLYTIKPIPLQKLRAVVSDYLSGQYSKWPEYFAYYPCKKIHVFASSVVPIILDGEIFYDSEIRLEICQASLDFVCPSNAIKTAKKTPAPAMPAISIEDFFLPGVSGGKESS